MKNQPPPPFIAPTNDHSECLQEQQVIETANPVFFVAECFKACLLDESESRNSHPLYRCFRSSISSGFLSNNEDGRFPLVMGPFAYIGTIHSIEGLEIGFDGCSSAPSVEWNYIPDRGVEWNRPAGRLADPWQIWSKHPPSFRWRSNFGRVLLRLDGMRWTPRIMASSIHSDAAPVARIVTRMMKMKMKMKNGRNMREQLQAPGLCSFRFKSNNDAQG